MSIVVTGATGFLAAHIVDQLLERGYNVRGTVRNKNDSIKIKYLKQIEENNKNKGKKIIKQKVI